MQVSLEPAEIDAPEKKGKGVSKQ
ncbi:hypothetical protein TNCV_4914671, partial [Trichonephila clavipes]